MNDRRLSLRLFLLRSWLVERHAVYGRSFVVASKGNVTAEPGIGTRGEGGWPGNLIGFQSPRALRREEIAYYEVATGHTGRV